MEFQFKKHDDSHKGEDYIQDEAMDLINSITKNGSNIWALSQLKLASLVIENCYKYFSNLLRSEPLPRKGELDGISFYVTRRKQISHTEEYEKIKIREKEEISVIKLKFKKELDVINAKEKQYNLQTIIDYNQVYFTFKSLAPKSKGISKLIKIANTPYQENMTIGSNDNSNSSINTADNVESEVIEADQEQEYCYEEDDSFACYLCEELYYDDDRWVIEGQSYCGMCAKKINDMELDEDEREHILAKDALGY